MCHLDTLNDNNILRDESLSRAKLCFRSLMTRKFRRAIPGKVLTPWAINTKAESGKATARIESDGYKKKLLASQTHLDLQTVLTLAFPLSLVLPPLVSILPSFLRDTHSPFLCTILSFIPGLSSTSSFFSRDYSGYFPIPLLHTRNLNYRCPSQSAATHSSASVSGSAKIACLRHYLHVWARTGILSGIWFFATIHNIHRIRIWLLRSSAYRCDYL